MHLFLIVLALVLFLLAGFGVPSGRFNLVAFGLAAWLLAISWPLTR